MYVRRHLESTLIQHFRGKSREGALVPGIVGCGKTTMITHVIESLKDEYDCFSFTGDETSFRSAVVQSGSYILDHIKARTNRKSLVFVDEIQKEEAIFDAIKIAFDKGHVSFIISGSNPEFIHTRATKRIQRRGRMFEMQPFSLPEILLAEGFLTIADWKRWESLFRDILFTNEHLPTEGDFPDLFIGEDISECIDSYIMRGGLPLAWQSSTTVEALHEVKKVFERGFEPILKDTANLSSIVAEALAETHAQEFTYQGIMQRSRVTQRRPIVDAINHLMAHGYLYSKQPWFPEIDRRSYISVYNYCDPGIVSYLQGSMIVKPSDAGHRIEAICHARLHHMSMLWPVRTHLNYYKPYVSSGSSIRFQSGEIDFILRVGKRIVPVEVKSSAQVDASDVPLLIKFVQEFGPSYGVVLYGGRPKIDAKNRIVFLPWFLS